MTLFIDDGALAKSYDLLKNDFLESFLCHSETCLLFPGSRNQNSYQNIWKAYQLHEEDCPTQLNQAAYTKKQKNVLESIPRSL